MHDPSSLKDKGGNVHLSQFLLLGKRRFLPYFLTQFLGAFNDNLYKNGLLLLIIFTTTKPLALDTDVLVNLAAALFILPFFIFSAFAGQLADHYEKSSIIRQIKLAEIIIMLLAAVALIFENIPALMLLIFLMGTQSAFFGPVKYAILPQHLRSRELVAGNALVEMGTFVAILLGTIGAGYMAYIPNGKIALAAAIVLTAVAGWLCARRIPPAYSIRFESVRWNPVTETIKTLGHARANKTVFRSILAISWFWAIGSAYLTQVPNFTKIVLGCEEEVVTLLLAAFIVGIATGSLICDRLSDHKIELGLVPIGAIGLSLFGFDLFIQSLNYQALESAGIGAFLQNSGSLHILADITAIGLFGGLFIVPLYALVQHRSHLNVRAQVIAANNIINALFMVAAAALGAILLGPVDWSIPIFFMILALLNLVVALYIFSVVPEFTIRFFVWLLSHSMYRVTHHDLDNLPEKGPAMIVCNHVSYVDALLLAGACRRPIRFVMDQEYHQLPVLNWIFRASKTIPITTRQDNPVIYQKAFEQTSEALRDGHIVCIFPEGKLTRDGEIGNFRYGIEKILQKDPVPVIPMALQGLWGSIFSHAGNKRPLRKPPRRFWSRIDIVCGEPVYDPTVSAMKLESIVRQLREDRK